MSRPPNTAARCSSLGGVEHLTGGSKAEGRATCETLLALCNRAPVELTVDGGAAVTVQAGRGAGGRRGPGDPDARRLRLGHDRHVRGRVARAASTRWWWSTTTSPASSPSTRPARSSAGSRPASASRPPLDARALLPGRRARHRLGRHRPRRPAGDPRPLRGRSAARARPAPADGLDHRRGIRLLRARRRPRPPAGAAAGRSSAPTVELIAENCEPALAHRPLRRPAPAARSAPASPRTRSGSPGRCRHRRTRLTCGGAPVYVWPGGGITFMVDVTRLPDGAFGYVPTPALVAPLEFTMRARRLPGPRRPRRPSIRSLDDILALGGEYHRRRRPPPGRGRRREPPAGRHGCPTAAACTCTTARSTSSSRPGDRPRLARRLRPRPRPLRRPARRAGRRAPRAAPPDPGTPSRPGGAGDGRRRRALPPGLHHPDGRGRRRGRRRRSAPQ